MKARRIARGYALEFEWFGGEYIDIKFVGDEYPFDCVNTDNELEFTRENFRKEITEYIRTVEATDLREYRLIKELR
jgi:hypothetical protein